MIVVRVAASFGSPRKAPHLATSVDGAHRAAQCMLINTVGEPLMIGAGLGPAGGAGYGGWASPPLTAPVHATLHVTYAAGSISMYTVGGTWGGMGGPITPLGTVMSCVTGSKMRAAGNTGFSSPLSSMTRRSGTPDANR
jgi:hypothetical protein